MRVRPEASVAVILSGRDSPVAPARACSILVRMSAGISSSEPYVVSLRIPAEHVATITHFRTADGEERYVYPVTRQSESAH